MMRKIMKTLSIKLFNLKTAKKNICNKKPVKHVEIPATLPKELGNELLALQNSLDYMATNCGLNFEIGYDTDDSWIKISKGDFCDIVYTNEYDSKLIAEQLYSSTSKALRQDDKGLDDDTQVIRIKSASDRAKSLLKNYKGLLEFYTKFYQGMIFEVNETETGILIESIFGLKGATCTIEFDKAEEGYSKIHKMIKDTMAVKEPPKATVPILFQ